MNVAKNAQDEAGWRCSSASRSARWQGSARKPRLLAGALLHRPVGVCAFDMRELREVERRRRGRRRPFRRASVPRIAGFVAQLLTPANADDKLHDLAGRCRSGSATAPPAATSSHRTPRGHVIVLHAARHSHQTQGVERHEGDVETDASRTRMRPCPARRAGGSRTLSETKRCSPRTRQTARLR